MSIRLTSLDRQSALPILRGFGLISPVIMQALLASDKEVLKQFMTWHGGPLYGANLCNFFRAGTEGGHGITDEVYSAVLDKLMDCEGYVLNGLRIEDSGQQRCAPGHLTLGRYRPNPAWNSAS